jgi:hypothetical protein
MRPLLALLMTVAGAGALAACGGDSPSSPPGSPENPLPAQSAEAGASAREPGAAAPADAGESGSAPKPGYKALVDRQSRKPRTRFTPCNLVSAAQAGEILGARVRSPVEAPQGPTCIYRTRGGGRFVTVSVQAMPFNRLKRNLRGLQRLEISDRAAYCGTYGQSMLYVPLAKGRVLTIAAPCGVAQQFATRAMREFQA